MPSINNQQVGSFFLSNICANLDHPKRNFWVNCAKTYIKVAAFTHQWYICVFSSLVIAQPTERQ